MQDEIIRRKFKGLFGSLTVFFDSFSIFVLSCASFITLFFSVLQNLCPFCGDFFRICIFISIL